MFKKSNVTTFTQVSVYSNEMGKYAKNNGKIQFFKNSAGSSI